MRARIALSILAAIGMLSAGLGAYSTASYKWAISPVPVYINPANADVSASAAVAAIQTAMSAWNNGGTSFRFSYAGQASDTATSIDGRNVVIFRNTANPDSSTAVATTYAWSQNGSRFDTDIVFWDGKYKFFTGSSGCAYTNGQYGAYIEDIATHELGHALGLMHSTLTDATMYPTYTQCSTAFRSLAADDVAGLKAVYSTAIAPVNTVPSVSISAPTSGASVVQGTVLTFNGSATDTQDGNLTSRMIWSSTLDGALGTGSGFTKSLSLGTHTVIASVTDNGGLLTTRQVSVTVTTVPTTSGTLTVSGSKTKTTKTANLTWSNVTAANIDVFRNGTKVKTTTNTGTTTDSMSGKGGGTYTYKVCAAGSATCSNNASVTF